VPKLLRPEKKKKKEKRQRKQVSEHRIERKSLFVRRKHKVPSEEGLSTLEQWEKEKRRDWLFKP